MEDGRPPAPAGQCLLSVGQGSRENVKAAPETGGFTPSAMTRFARIALLAARRRRKIAVRADRQIRMFGESYTW